MYLCTKTFPPLSCAFRQWKAKSHCHFIHGYALSIKLTFSAPTLDEYNWVVDFGGLKTFRAWLEETFDHKLLVAEDDPERGHLALLHHKGIADVRVIPVVSCEAFAAMIAKKADDWLLEVGHYDRVRVAGVEVREHEANAATYYTR